MVLFRRYQVRPQYGAANTTARRGSFRPSIVKVVTLAFGFGLGEAFRFAALVLRFMLFISYKTFNKWLYLIALPLALS